MGHSIIAEYKSGMEFEINIMGHKITVDAKPDAGGNDSGPSPKPLMLAALAGCTGMDVVSILKKMKVGFEDFSIKIDGELNEEHPKKYNKMHVTYRFRGEVPLDKAETAIKLSVDKYCGVFAVYKEAVEMSYSIEINGEKKL